MCPHKTLSSSRPRLLAELLNSTSTIESVFDAIMYQKGASVLRMLRAWANRASRTAPLPLHESVPGTSPSKVRECVHAARTVADVQERRFSAARTGCPS